VEFVFISPMGVTFFSSSRLGVDLAGCAMVFARSVFPQSPAIEATFIGGFELWEQMEDLGGSQKGLTKASKYK
jgi:hypothetical protein